MDAVFEVKTGVPKDIASRAGRPKPSYRDGNNTAFAPRIRLTRRGKDA
jgi:hypothetical protein